MAFNQFYNKIGSVNIGWKNILLIAIIAFILIFPNIFYLVHVDASFILIIKYVVIAWLFILNPLVLFYRNIKIYLYILSVFVLFVPLVCFSIYLFDLKFGARMAGLIFQTNMEETLEITQGYRLPFLFITLFFLAIYIFFIRKISVKRIPFILALVISVSSIVIVWSKMFQLKKDFQVTSMYGILDEYYPVSVISGIAQVLFIAPNNLDKAKNFSFRAFKKDALKQRQVYILIIGESSRYDHWEINGYSRATSPRLAALKNLITFSDVAAGAHFTWLSVPQMITRATPDNMSIQYSEKSILSAFEEAGFKTIWLSNQSPDYYTGSFTLHAETADICMFPDAKELDHSRPFDGRYLPLIDSIISNSDRNLFMVFHTMGSHWDYSKRYPETFDHFKPSGKTINISPPESNKRNAIINSYDNSILYSDFIIDSVIDIVKKQHVISYVTFVSDHGEDLFNLNKDQLNFHLTASRTTLHIPLFIWTSKKYNAEYSSKKNTLLANRDRKIGENDIFYTLLDLSNVTYPGFDSTKSISSQHFQDSRQEYIEQGDKQVKYFSTFNKSN